MPEDITPPSSGDNNLPATRSEGWAPSWVANLKSIPGALAAVGQLVTGSTKAGTSLIDIGTAQNEREAQAIRDQTEARSALSKAAVKAMAKELGRDPERAGRYLDRMLAEGDRKQESREVIGIKALEIIRDDPPKSEIIEPPTEDWINIFGSYAERASSETMRQHWAHILAGEIRRPGQFSYATLHLASLLDEHFANAIARVAEMVVDDQIIPYVSDFNTSGQLYEDMILLESIGFLAGSSASKELEFDENGIIEIRVCEVVVRVNRNPNAKISVQGSVVSRSGNELLSIVSAKANKEFIEKLKTELETGSDNVSVQKWGDMPANNAQSDSVNSAIRSTEPKSE